MPAVAAYPQPNSNNNKHSNVDFEPDEEWKSQVKKRIEDSLESMVREVKENQAAELRKEVVTSETRLRIAEDYKQAMNNIKAIATEHYQEELDRERNERLWTTGVPLDAEWSRILTEEQQRIMDTIKQSSNQDDKDATGSPTDERRPVQPSQTGVVAKESAKSPRSASQAPQSISHIAPSSKEDREQSVGSPVEPPRSARRGSDARSTVPRGRDDRSGSIRRRRGPSHSRSNRPGELDSPDQPEDLPHPQAPYSGSPADQPPPSPEVNRLNSSLGRNGSMRSASSHTAFSPPKPVSDVWKSTAALDDDASAAKSYNLGRRGSSTSIKSTGSGTAVRPAISETIPERVDDAEGDFGSNDRGSHEQKKVRKHHREDRRAGRKNSRSTTADASSYSDEPLPMWSAGPSSVVMQLATSPAPAKSLTSKTSFVNGEERYHRDHYREPPYPPYSARDAPTRAIPPRSPYGLDDRDYPVSYQTPHRPPKSLHGRDHPSISSFNNYDDKYDRRRDYDWDAERDYDDDRERGKEGESEYRDNWERDRDPYSEHRYPNHHPYPSRSPYPATSRHSSHDYVHMHDLHDDRETPLRARGYGYRGHGPPPSPPDEWDHQRPESAPTRQPSYSRDDRDQYSRGYPSSNSIPISSRHPPSSEDLPVSSWREWGVDGNGTRRLSDSRYDSYTRSPSNAEHFSRRRQPRYNGDSTHSDLSPSSSRRKKPPPPLDGIRRDLDYEGTLDEYDSDEEPIVGQSEEDENDLGSQAKELEDERRQADERIKEKAAEIRRLQEEEMRLEEEARRKEEEVKKKEEEMRRKEEESKRVEDEIRKKEAEAIRKAEEAKRKEEEAKRKEREARRKEQEAARKADDANKLAREAGRKADEAKRKEDEINKKEERARKKEERLKEDAERTRKLQLEANRITKEAQLKQEALEKLEQETRRKEQEIEERERALKAREEELKIREEEARKLEEGAWRKEEDARRKEAEAKRKELEAKRKEEEVKRKEEETRKKEMETRRKEEEARRRDEEAARVRQEMLRREQSVRRGQDSDFFEESFLEDYDLKFLEEQAKLLQQAQYRKREEEIRRNREERKRQDSIGSESAWSAPGTLPGAPKPFPPLTPQPPYTAPSPAPNGNPAAWTTWGAPPLKPSNITSSATSRSTSTTLPQLNKPRNGSVSSGSHPTSTSPHTATPISESEWARRHAEFTNNQQEKFRREQEKLESERQVRAAGKPLSRDEVQRVFEHHDRLWTRLPTISELTWVDFPWPVLRTASNADDITFTFVNAYFLSPFLLEKEKSKSLKDRIKEHLRRWHPDRFDSKVLPRVVELEKEKVKQGAGNVVRYLNDLLRKENENGSIPNLFGE